MAKQLKAIVPKNGPRVVLAVTTDDNPQISDDVELVDIPEEPDFQTGKRYKILNEDLSFRDASEQEIDDADVDPEKRQAKRKAYIQQFRDAMDAVVADEKVPPSVKDFVVALKRLY